MNVKVTNEIEVNLPLAGASRVRSVRDFHRAGRRIGESKMKKSKIREYRVERNRDLSPDCRFALPAWGSLEIYGQKETTR